MINTMTFGYLNGKEIKAFTLENEYLQVTVLNYGGIIQSFKVYKKKKKLLTSLGILKCLSDTERPLLSVRRIKEFIKANSDFYWYQEIVF